MSLIFLNRAPNTQTLTNTKLCTKNNSHVLVGSHKKVVFIYYQMKGFKERAPYRTNLLTEPMNQQMSYSPTVRSTIITAEIIYQDYIATTT